jgi:adenylate kinase family enzyme
LRIFVRGTSGAGKTTLARRIAERWGAEYVEMDAIHHLPNWAARPREETQAIVAEIVQRESWVIDGNYGHAIDPHLERADMVVWLDYSFAIVFWRVLSRTVRRSLRREELWAGNRETFQKAFLSRDSILWWMVTTFHRRRRQCHEVKRRLENSSTRFVHLTSPLAAELWLASLDA